MTQCDFCKENLWNEGQTSCSGGQCGSAYDMAQEMGIEFDEYEFDEDENEEDE